MQTESKFVRRALPAAALLALGLAAVPAEAQFTATCYAESNTTYNYNMTSWTRTSARSYAYVGVSEGYQWGGGCWNDTNTDNTPGQPTSCSGSGSTGGEGGDCSGFVFKSWALRTSTSDTGFKYWNRMTNVHGPYTANSYYSGTGAVHTIAKDYATTQNMDAFASTGHIGMIYTEGTSNNQDSIVEALNEASGTTLATRTYRGSTSYRGVRRDVWTP